MNNQPLLPTTPTLTSDLLRTLPERELAPAAERTLPDALLLVLVLILALGVLLIGPLVAMLALFGGLL